MKNLHKFLRPRATAEDVATLLNEFGACPVTLEPIDADPKRRCALAEKHGSDLGGIPDEEIDSTCVACLAAYLNEEVQDGKI